MWICLRCGEPSLIPCSTDIYVGVSCKICGFFEWHPKH